jgi:calpain-15
VIDSNVTAMRVKRRDGVGDRGRADDFFPCSPETRQPCFTRCKGSELWVVILEKAWAKVHGSYQSIEGGDSGDVLAALTGAP